MGAKKKGWGILGNHRQRAMEGIVGRGVLLDESATIRTMESGKTKQTIKKTQYLNRGQRQAPRRKKRGWKELSLPLRALKVGLGVEKVSRCVEEGGGGGGRVKLRLSVSV